MALMVEERVVCAMHEEIDEQRRLWSKWEEVMEREDGSPGDDCGFDMVWLHCFCNCSLGMRRCCCGDESAL